MSAAARCLRAGCLAFVIVAWTTATVGAVAVEPACEARAFDELGIEGCPESLCGDSQVLKELHSLVGFKPGQSLSLEGLKLVRRRLLRTGFFRGVKIRCQRKDERWHLMVGVVPNSFVRELEIVGSRHFMGSEIRKRVFLRPGSILNVTPGREDESEDVRRQIDSIQRMYAKDGLEDVLVAIEAKPVDASWVDIRVRIKEGERKRIRRVVLKHTQTEVKGIRCPVVSRRALIKVAGIGVGDTYVTRLQGQVRRRIRAYLQSLGFDKPRVDLSFDPTAQRILITVVTDRCWLLRLWERSSTNPQAASLEPAFRFPDPVQASSLGTVGRSGYQRVELEAWRESLPFAESGSFDREEAARGVTEISQSLEGRGFLFAEVTMEYRRLSPTVGVDGQGSSPVLGIIDYFITHNYERRVQAIEFPGRKQISSEFLTGLLDTKVYNFFDPGGQLVVERFLLELDRINTAYLERGFYGFEFALRGQSDDEAPSRMFRDEADRLVWEFVFRNKGFRVIKRKGQMVVTIEVPILEGPQSVIRRVSVEGAKALPEARLRELLNVRFGEPFERRKLSKGLKAINAWYQAHGYPRVAVELLCSQGEVDATNCDTAFMGAGPVDLQLRIKEGRIVVIGERFWRGNAKTEPSILLRDLPKPGTLYSPAAITRAARRMRNLGVFDSVHIEVIGLDAETGDLGDLPRHRAALVVIVEEADSRFVNLAMGIRSVQRAGLQDIDPIVASMTGHSVARADHATTGAIRPHQLSIPDILLFAEVEYLDRHVLGRGHELKLPLRYGILLNRLLALEPQEVDLISFEPSWAEPRLFGTDVRLELALLGEFDRVTEVFDRTELGARATVTSRVTEDMALSVETKAGLLGFANVQGAEEGTGGLQPQFQASMRWSYDTHDNPVHPRRGVAVSLGLSGILNRDVVDDRLFYNEYAKWDLSLKATASLSKGLIIAAQLRYGGSTGNAESPLPPNERFFLGGSNGMRGFEDSAVGRYDRDGFPIVPTSRLDFGGNVVLNGSFEARFPLLESLGLWSVLFTDVGALAASHHEIYLSSFRVAVGTGLRFLIGGHVPVRLDAGFVVGDRRCLPGQGEFVSTESGCRIEQRLQVHFGFLYPF